MGADESESVDESESESEQESNLSDSYDPEEDSFDYAIDAEDDIDSEFQVDAESEVESTFESELDDEDLSEQGSYAPSQDSFDYALDEQDDIASESAESEAELEESAESEVSLESAETFAEEMASALAHVERLGRAQSEPLIHAICDIHSKFTGEEATLSQLVSVFGDIRQSFAEEAAKTHRRRRASLKRNRMRIRPMSRWERSTRRRRRRVTKISVSRIATIRATIPLIMPSTNRAPK